MIYAARMRRSTTILATIIAFALLIAASAQAQSSGDQQYTDPFAGSGGSTTKTHTTPHKPAASSPAPTPAPAPAAPTVPAPAPAAGAAAGATLPRTGLDLIPLAALGATLLAAGAALVAWSRTERTGGR